MDYFDWAYGIVPLDYPGTSVPYPTPTPTPAPPRLPASYEQPWYVDTINRAIERAAQVATIEAGGYPPYPEYRTQAPQPMPLPTPLPDARPQPQQASINVPTNLLLWGAIFGAFFLLGKGRR